jgi:thiol:disulfide interchange protein DsbD
LDKRLYALLITFLVLALPGQAARAAGLGERLRGLLRDGPDAGTEEFLPADQAFRFAASVAGPDRLDLFWEIADGYYLYHDKFSFTVVRGAVDIGRGKVDVPAGKVKHDENFCDVEVNTGDVSVSLPLHRTAAGPVPIVLKVGYQGCKDNEVCYPPVTREVALTLPARQAAE